MEFIDFPETRYIWNGEVQREEKKFSEQETRTLLTKELIIQEKVDGTNIGISFNENGEFLFQHRGEYIRREEGEYSKLSQWSSRHKEGLERILGTKRILFGEWVLEKHSILYDRLPSYFLAFDLFDREEQRFLSQAALDRHIVDTGICSIPLLYKGNFSSLEDLQALLQTSHFGEQRMEGLYLRRDSELYNEERAKFVRRDFQQQIKKHWKKGKRERNRSLDPLEHYWSH